MTAPKPTYSVDGCVLTLLDTGAVVEFSWPVRDVIQFDQVFVVRFEPDPDSCCNENVVGVRASGGLAWTIEKRPHVYNDSPYTSILREDGHVKLFNWDGSELLVNPTTGAVIAADYGK
jgi:hypothetical protein